MQVCMHIILWEENLERTRKKSLRQYTLQGLGMKHRRNFFVSTQIEKEENQPVNVIAGMQYKFLPQIIARVGIAANTSNLYAGVGLFLKSFRLDIVASYHPQLGATPGLMFVYNSSKKNE